jgi:thiamine-phosphate pyrophosphorylase
MKKEDRIAAFEKVDIYPVTCEKLSAGRSNLEVLQSVIQGGAKIIQLREKEYSGRALYEIALKFREMTKQAAVLLMINDHLDVALAVGADGVHLGQDDLPINVAKELAPELIIGASTHSMKQALQAQKNGADYINIGPIFPTQTKEGATNFLGPEAISQISPEIQVPFTVMGGIKASNIDEVLSQGARHVAMVTAITQAPNITETVKALREKFRNASEKK